jgi:hypothetical protein
MTDSEGMKGEGGDKGMGKTGGAASAKADRPPLLLLLPL